MTEEWPKVRVGEVATIIGGGTPSTTKPEYWGGEIAWLSPKDLSRNPSRFTYFGERNITEAGLASSSARMLPKGAVLLTSRAPIGYVTIAGQPICTNQGFKSLILDESQNSEFWYYLLRSSTKLLHSVANGSTFQEISGKTLSNLEFRLPDLKEQNNIARVLGALDDLIEFNLDLAEKLDHLVKQMGRQFIGSLSTIDLVELGQVIHIDRGYSYKSSELVGNSQALVNLKNINRDGSWRSDGIKPLTAVSAERHTVENGSIVVAMTDLTQDRSVIGRAVRVRRGRFTGEMVASLDLSIPRPTRLITNEYLAAVISTPEFHRHAHGYCNGTTVLHMSVKAVPEFQIPLPTQSDVDQFTETVKQLNEYADELCVEASIMLDIHKDLTKLLMSGKVRVGDIPE